MRLGDHLCLPYRSVAERRTVLGCYARDGLAAHQRVVFVGAPGEALGLLRPQIPDVDRHLERGALVVAGTTETFLPDGAFDPVRQMTEVRADVDLAREQGYTGLRLAGDHGWALSGAPGTDRLLEFEHDLDVFLADAAAMAMCLYDAGSFGDRLPGLVAAHAGLVGPDPDYDDGVLRITAMFEQAGLRLSGEIDYDRHAVLGGHLHGVAAAGQGDVVLDMSGVEFIDMAGLRLLLSVALGLPGGRRLIIQEAPGHLRRTLELAGWAGVAGLVIKDAIGGGDHRVAPA